MVATEQHPVPTLAAEKPASQALNSQRVFECDSLRHRCSFPPKGLIQKHLRRKTCLPAIYSPIEFGKEPVSQSPRLRFYRYLCLMPAFSFAKTLQTCAQRFATRGAP
jgi:hypothetical protein